MKRDGKCPKCGSTEVIPNLVIPDYYELGIAGDMSLEASANPDAWIFKGTKSSTLRAHVCGSCGFAELYVDDPRLLWEAYQKSRRG